ncbi:flagellar motor protein MotB [Photobacterium kishitanii]|uniref:flagellar motor protein MotB n=1 Tax=Photobacterium kishitanii TaxID=318456 RepID=UPI0027386244|nr:flagellar motor protein MotB [Photobacterium kishitanii]
MAKPPTEVLKKYYIIKKVRGHGDDHHGGAWKIALADFYTTLAMVFFVLWVAGTVPEDKLAGVSEFFKQDVKQTYNAIKLDANGKVLSEKNTQDDVSGSKEDAKDNEDIKEDKPNKETIIAVYNQLSKELDKNVAEVILAKNKESIEIKFVADLLFKSASDDLSPKSIKSIDKVGLILNGKGLYAHVYGFADNRKNETKPKV